ncbi:MAG: hypothetical protein M1815_002199 [Lichina confinis]|nr:MAG: hypothetical protein M1815_002199 [Lichina confinis]
MGSKRCLTDEGKIPRKPDMPTKRAKTVSVIGRGRTGADVLTRLSTFLPELAASNEQLEEERASGKIEERQLENVREDEAHIEMNLGLGVLEEVKDSSGSELETDGDASSVSESRPAKISSAGKSTAKGIKRRREPQDEAEDRHDDKDDDDALQQRKDRDALRRLLAMSKQASAYRASLESADHLFRLFKEAVGGEAPTKDPDRRSNRALHVTGTSEGEPTKTSRRTAAREDKGKERTSKRRMIEEV